MPQTPAQKLTKKQRKGLAFRQKVANRKGRKAEKPGEPEDVPEADIIIDDELDLDALDKLRPDSSNRRIEGWTQSEGDVKKQVLDATTTTKKRKRPQPERSADRTSAGDEHAPNQKKRKQQDEKEDVENKDAKSQKHKSRYILFVGNLKYTTSKEAIQAHFAHTDPPPTIRLLTPKPSRTPSTKSLSTKSKGCAFLEFTSRNALQQALKLHHSTLDGRQINVELTAGGGGKSTARLEKLKGRNSKLEMQRKNRLQKPSTDPGLDSDSTPTQLTTPTSQRHSSTSGSTSAPTPKRTWSVPEADDEVTHRGGVKHGSAKKRGLKKRKSKDLGTGVNAIPVG